MNIARFSRFIPTALRPSWERFSQSSTAHRLAGGAFWATVAAVASRVAALVTSIIVARTVGPAGFGELGTVQGTIGMLGVFAGLGLGMTATKYVATYLQSDCGRASRLIGLSSLLSWICGVLLGIVLVILAPWIATRILGAPELVIYLQAASLYLLFSSVNGAQQGVLYGFEAFKEIAVVNIVSGVINLVCTVLGARWWGVLGAVCGMSVTQAFTCLFTFVAVRRKARERNLNLSYRGCWSERHVIWSFSAPALLSSVLVTPALWVCNSIMVNQPNGFVEAGIFNAANQWRQAILFFPTTLAAVTLPMLSGFHGGRNMKSYRRVLLVSLALSLVSALLVAFPVVAFSSVIMGGYGHAFVAGAPVLSLLSMVAVVMAGLNVVGQTIACEGRMWIGALLNMLWGTVLIGSYYMLRQQGAQGFGTANLIAYGFHLINSLIYVYWSWNKRGLAGETPAAGEDRPAGTVGECQTQQPAEILIQEGTKYV